MAKKNIIRETIERLNPKKINLKKMEQYRGHLRPISQKATKINMAVFEKKHSELKQVQKLLEKEYFSIGTAIDNLLTSKANKGFKISESKNIKTKISSYEKNKAQLLSAIEPIVLSITEKIIDLEREYTEKKSAFVASRSKFTGAITEEQIIEDKLSQLRTKLKLIGNIKLIFTRERNTDIYLKNIDIAISRLK